MTTEDGWHREVLPPETQQAIAGLSTIGAARAFYLAGGTALAVQWGHRTSADLDFFTADAFSEEMLIGAFELGSVRVISKAPETLHLHIGNCKVSFLGYHYPVLFPLKTFDRIRVADPRDIAAMKLSAIASRSAKRDFVDLYMASLRYDLGELVDVFEQKFAAADYNIVHILKSLTYFADADKEPMPHMLQPLVWADVREFFKREAPLLRERR